MNRRKLFSYTVCPNKEGQIKQATRGHRQFGTAIALTSFKVECEEELPHTRTIINLGKPYYLSFPYIQYFFIKYETVYYKTLSFSEGASQQGTLYGNIALTFSQHPATGAYNDPNILKVLLPHLTDSGCCGIAGTSLESCISTFWLSRFVFSLGYEGAALCQKTIGGLDAWAKKTQEDPAFILRDNISVPATLMATHGIGSKNWNERNHE